jgi:hypothetical protein
LRTLENLCSAVSASGRPNDRARQRTHIPSLESELRRGCLAIDLPDERIDAILDELRGMYVAGNDADSRDDRMPPVAGGNSASSRGSDFVAEMIIGTWVEFRTGDEIRRMQLWHATPLRARYVFKGRGQARGWVLTPEDLVHEFETGKVSLMLEPVPLFERAIDAVFNTIGGGEPRRFRYTAGRELETTANWTLQ